jgi:Tfp pilus assembly protein PilV
MRVPLSRPGPLAAARSGITLMEVLIAIGILSIGLTSVVAILPAGRKQAAKAILYDRASLLAANALADAVTSGLCREHSLSSSAANVSVDPLGVWSVTTPPTNATWRQTGVYATSGAAAVSSTAAVARQFMQARDDLEFTPTANEDAASPVLSCGRASMAMRSPPATWQGSRSSSFTTARQSRRTPSSLRVSRMA